MLSRSNADFAAAEINYCRMLAPTSDLPFKLLTAKNSQNVGVSSLFNSRFASNWMQVSVGGRVWRVAAETFRRKFNDCREMQKLLHDYINSYISQITQKVICNSYHTVEERLCCWLLMVENRCGRKSLRLTQEQIAGFLGVHRPSVTLITQALREKGIIDYSRARISIRSREKLISSSCDCYAPAKNYLNFSPVCIQEYRT